MTLRTHRWLTVTAFTLMMACVMASFLALSTESLVSLRGQLFWYVLAPGFVLGLLLAIFERVRTPIDLARQQSLRPRSVS